MNALVGVIPCGGYGTRLASYTNRLPKALLRIGDKSLLEYNLTLMEIMAVSRLAIVISKHTENIRSYVGSQFHGIPIDYVEQNPPQGLLHAIYQTRNFVEDRFVTLLSDELYIGSRHRSFIEYWSAHSEVSGLVGFVIAGDPNDIKKNYSIKMHDLRIDHLEEKPSVCINSLLGTGTWALTKLFFDYASMILAGNPPEKRNFVDALQHMIDDGYLIEGYDLLGKYVNINSPVDISLAQSLIRCAG